MNQLLHRENFEHVLLGGTMAARLDERAEDARISTTFDDKVSVVIRTRNDAGNLEIMFDEISGQYFNGELEVVLVDTESTDGTTQLASKYGAEVVNIKQDDFSYPKALNLGMSAVSHEAVFITVGHANLSNKQTLSAVIKHADSTDIAGAYGKAIPSAAASRTERLMAAVVLPDLRKPAAKIAKIEMGALAATGSMIRKSAWQDLGGFDESFAAGGEDTELARRMLTAGMGVVLEPALTVHHSHGLGPINSFKQLKHWAEVFKGPGDFDVMSLAKRRPDLDLG